MKEKTDRMKGKRKESGRVGRETDIAGQVEAVPAVRPGP